VDGVFRDFEVPKALRARLANDGFAIDGFWLSDRD
jgi:hypothetical protein